MRFTITLKHFYILFQGHSESKERTHLTHANCVYIGMLLFDTSFGIQHDIGNIPPLPVYFICKFEKYAAIENPTSCEVQSVIIFC